MRRVVFHARLASWGINDGLWKLVCLNPHTGDLCIRRCRVHQVADFALRNGSATPCFSGKLIGQWIDGSLKHHSHFFPVRVSCTWKEDKATAPAFCSEAGMRKLSHFRPTRNKRCASNPALFCSNTFPSFRETKRKKRREKKTLLLLPWNLDAPFSEAVTLC